jgi:hypothetical protein
MMIIRYVKKKKYMDLKQGKKKLMMIHIKKKKLNWEVKV